MWLAKRRRCCASCASRRRGCARGITRLSLFRSTARGEAGPKSDIGLLIEVDPAACFGLSDLLDRQEELAALLARPINFAFASEMRPWLQQWIEEVRIEIS